MLQTSHCGSMTFSVVCGHNFKNVTLRSRRWAISRRSRQDFNLKWRCQRRLFLTLHSLERGLQSLRAEHCGKSKCK